MNKIKKLIPVILLSSLFTSVPSSVLAMMDTEASSNSTVLSTDEVSERYKSCKFNSANLYDQICKRLNITKNKDGLEQNDKVRIIREANKIIDDHVKNCHGIDLLKFKDNGGLNFEAIMRGSIINLENTGEFNSFAKSFILYLLAEHIGFEALIKIVSYDDYNAKSDKIDKHYVAVVLFGPYFGSAQNCIFNPIAFDTKKNEFWKDIILNNPKKHNVKEYYLAIPHPTNSGSSISMVETAYNCQQQNVFDINYGIYQNLAWLRKEPSFEIPYNLEYQKTSVNLSDAIEEISKPAY